MAAVSPSGMGRAGVRGRLAGGWSWRGRLGEIGGGLVGFLITQITAMPRASQAEEPSSRACSPSGRRGFRGGGAGAPGRAWVRSCRWRGGRGSGGWPGRRCGAPGRNRMPVPPQRWQVPRRRRAPLVPAAAAAAAAGGGAGEHEQDVGDRARPAMMSRRWSRGPPYWCGRGQAAMPAGKPRS